MKTLMSVKVDKETKEKAQYVARRLGLPLSTVVNRQLYEFAHLQSIVFCQYPRMTSRLERVSEKALEDYQKGIHISPPLQTPEDLGRYLGSL